MSVTARLAPDSTATSLLVSPRRVPRPWTSTRSARRARASPWIQPVLGLFWCRRAWQVSL